MSQILPYRPKHSSLETAEHHSDFHAIVLPPPPDSSRLSTRLVSLKKISVSIFINKETVLSIRKRLNQFLISLDSDSFENLISCIKNVTRVCEHSWRSDKWIDMDVRLKFRKQFYCHDGALILPMALCRSGYYRKGPKCVREFHRKFRNDTSDPSLCE